MNFTETLQDHLQAVSNKDLERFLLTVHPDITLVLPNGKYIDNDEEFKKFHESWFADDDWRIQFEIVKVLETEGMCSALLRVIYDDIDPNNQPYQKKYYLQLLFKKKDGKWLLVFDQNTFM
ncbi:YybH family protein [Chengkuizengella axinellae]|uniref:Nuclear transport factor 2 family protein n=1 Tax=Chengkuizengella axinellae TaxID=3064388 RepID=A0ABT9IWI2_9BACL|nr:nuclear transport factor 2 family protein [Chengkuizengella sp. 2205SS18-9]MDP5273706.1 nuclear transport factor 2 family protein [Chengkuizengella sp. 2205SS18-9]